jgi:pSer/pThr/pTyr-binding forkhead associated (FHA) protein
MVSDRSQGSAERARDASSGSNTQPSRLDVENPWPGLAAYDEASRDFFHGREHEALELLRLIRLAPLTALYGKSGLGKTSLLQAGLFPLLREQHFLPVYLRIDFSEGATDPLEQVARPLEEELARAGAEYPERNQGETLWDHLHREDLEIWSKDNFPLMPVLVFDQFDEMFSHRVDDPKRAEKRRNSLANLFENRIPAELASDAAKRSRLNLLSLHYRVVLSCREDYLPDLKSWEKDVPSLLRNYLRLEPMTRQCAIDTVEASGETVLADNVAPSIVDFVGKLDQRANRTDEAIIEPVLLCLCCYQLNRLRKDGEKISKELVDRAGRDILDNFYQTALGDKHVGGPPDVPTFIEIHLIQGDRFRGAYPKAEAIEEGLLTQTQLDALTDRLRLLRVVQHTDTARIELIHDRLVEVVCRARDERKLRERQVARERETAAEAVRKIKRSLRRVGSLIVLSAFGLLFYSSYTQWEESRAWATLYSATNGRRFSLSQDVAIVGRPTPSSASIFQVELRNREVSRIHLMVLHDFYAMDVRSLYGTTVNSELLQYGEPRRLEDGDVIGLAGVAAFVFHPLTYHAWQYFWRTPPPSDEVAPTGWGLLIDGKRRLVFPLTQDEVFIAPIGDGGVEPHDHPEGAIAIVRRRDVVGHLDIESSRATVELTKRGPEDPDTAEVDLFAFARPGTTGQSVDFNAASWLTIEDVADGQALEADIKPDDYFYGRFVVPEAHQYFMLRSSHGVRDHSLNELAFRQGERRFQVIWRDPDVESDSRDNPR